MSLGQSFPSTLDAARSGADWAVAALYKDLQPPLLGYLRSKCPAEAEDLAQETWVDVASGVLRFEGGEQDFRRFVFTIARRRLIDHLRRAASRPVQPAPDTFLAMHGAWGDVQEEALARLSADDAIEAISKLLPPVQAEIVLLRVLGHFSVEEVALMIGKRPGTVRSHQFRALRRVAAALSRDHATNSFREAM
jgi:RNA polymerase sigma-70 factor, ECF subfamily